MQKKKVLLIAVAAVLVCTVSVLGTLAYLTAQSNNGEGITNTFVSAGGLYTDTFEIQETPVEIKEDGNYGFVSEADPLASGIDYTIQPGQSLDKDATVVIDGKTDVESYLFVEVVSNLTDDVYDWSVDADNWLLVEDVEGLNGGDVYVYAQKVEEVMTPVKVTADLKVNILTDNKITVDSDATESTLAAITSDAKDSLSFYGYLTQASAGANAKASLLACGFATETK